MWKQVNHFTREQVKENEDFFSKLLTNRVSILVNNWNEQTMAFLSHSMKYVDLKIYLSVSEAMHKFRSFLISLNSGVYPNLSISDMKILDIYIMSKLSFSQEVANLLIENLPVNVLINCPKILINNKKISVNGLCADNLQEEIDKVNSIENPWLKMIDIQYPKDFNSLNAFLAELKKPVRYLFVKYPDSQFMANSTLEEGSLKAIYGFDDKVGELLKSITVMGNVIHIKDDLYDSNEYTPNVIKLASNLNTIYLHLLKSVSFDWTFKLDVQINEENIDSNYEMQFNKPKFVIYVMNEVYIMEAEKVCIKITDKSHPIRFEELKEDSGKYANISFGNMYKTEITNPRVIKMYCASAAEMIPGTQLVISDQYLVNIHVDFNQKMVQYEDLEAQGWIILRQIPIFVNDVSTVIIEKHEDKMCFELSPLA
jgi:hypothetical protein